MDIDSEKKINWISILNYFIFSFIGCIATIYCVVIKCNIVVASSIVAIILSVLAITLQDERRFSLAGFAGSFAGMTAPFLISGISNNYGIHFFIASLLLSLTVAFLYSFSEIVSVYYPKVFFDGFGGRLGFIAFLSVLVYLLLFRHSPDVRLFKFNDISLISSPLKVIPILIASSGGAMVSMEVKHAMSSLNENYKVLSVALTGIIGGILIERIPCLGHHLACAWYAGAFVGMSSYFILMFKRHFFFAGLFCGILYVIGEPLFVGVGGKLGFISFLSVMLMSGINALISHIKQHRATVDIEQLSTGDISNMSVNDDFAQKLVESLMQAKENGIDNIPLENMEIGNFVIGEKEEYTAADVIEEENNNQAGYENLDEIEKSCADFLNESGAIRWFYVQEMMGYFAITANKNISPETLGNFNFPNTTSLVAKLLKEKRVVGFTKNGIKQSFFESRISEADRQKCSYLALLPKIWDDELKGVFFVFYEKEDEESLKEQIGLLKQYYQYSYLHK